MTKRMPPTPPENRSPKGPAQESTAGNDQGPRKKDEDRSRNLEQQGRQGNVRQNTHHQGYQQDR